jgi:Secretion system C-terminal sorting domain
MMKNSKLVATALFWLTFALNSNAQDSKNYSVLAWANTTSDPATITINFEGDPMATSYEIYRENLGFKGNFDYETPPIATLTNDENGNLSFVDKNIVEGRSYVYFVKKLGKNNFVGYGYLNVGVRLAAVHNRGTLMLIVEKTAKDSLSAEIEILKRDLVGDGYHLVEYIVKKDDNHETIAAEIQNTKDSFFDLNTIYIFGHVPVPYSGNYCSGRRNRAPPDGHKAGNGDHCGAWAADVFYSVPNADWTDNDSITFGAGNEWNRNIPGDGKYDQYKIPDESEYALGRVDLYNMPAFSLSEFGLLRQYISKSHDYKNAIIKPYKRALIDQNFTSTEEAFAGNGYRNFPAMVGHENIIEADFISTLADSTFLWAYGGGPGSFSSAAGIGTTEDFSNNQGAAAFNFLFGSFFGDWDNRNSFLRAPLAVKNGGLTSAWTGRPWWHTHPMALNQTIGYCTRLVQNNNYEYNPGGNRRNIHIALMGDPTLRMHMFAPPTNVIAEVREDRKQIDLSWTPTVAEDIDGYNIYFSSSAYGPFVKANNNLIQGTNFSHYSQGVGTFYYMIRAQRLENTLSGSFHNLSQGDITEVNDLILATLAVDESQKIHFVHVYPNPTKGLVNIDYTNYGGDEVNISIYDMKGIQVEKLKHNGNGEQSLTLDLSHLTSGVYVVNINEKTTRLIVE